MQMRRRRLLMMMIEGELLLMRPLMMEVAVGVDSGIWGFGDARRPSEMMTNN